MSGYSPTPVWEFQRGLDDLGQPLSETTFVVVDLETTGGSPTSGSMITEIGAVKVCGGEVLGEFATLVDPETTIPSFISSLTGITNAMVSGAPTIDSVLPSFLEFAAGSVLVAHNAPFDIGFLKHFCKMQDRPWPKAEVLDTVRIARRVVTRDETPNCKLSSLATLFGSPVSPTHRALDDARATVHVLNALMERVGAQGVQTLEDLRAFTGKVTNAQRAKRHLAESLPRGPGVYLFKDEGDRVLYIGTSRNVQARVRTYFTASETRSRMGEMVQLAHRVDTIECATPLEAAVRELRLLAHHKPSYNRRSRFPERAYYVKITREPWPRLSLVRQVNEDDDHLGPFNSRRTAQACVDALHETFPVRQCTEWLPRSPSRTACVLAEMGRCLSPCDGSTTPETYIGVVDRLRQALREDPEDVVTTLTERMERYAVEERFEEAGTHRDRLATFVRSTSRAQRLMALSRCVQLVAARREDDGRWAVHVVRNGRLAAAGVIPPRTNAHHYVEGLLATAETVVGREVLAASAEEGLQVLRWLESPGIRLVQIEGEWVSPARGATRLLSTVDAVEQARSALVPFDERRLSTPVHRPAP